MTRKKIQISVTLDDAQLAWMDSQIKESRFATRSHAILYALTRLMKESENISDKGNGEAVPVIA